MNVRDAYNSWSSTYDTDRNLTRDLDRQVTRETLSGLHPAYILELGCGTGKNTAFLAQIGAQVQALDFSAGMLQQARAKVPNANVVFNVADLTRSWPCADQAADLIVCNLVLEHIADLTHIFAEAKRCLDLCEGATMAAADELSLDAVQRLAGGEGWREGMTAFIEKRRPRF